MIQVGHLNIGKLLLLSVVVAGVVFAAETYLQPGSGGSLLMSLTFWLGLSQGCVALMAGAEIVSAKWHKPILARMLSAQVMMLFVILAFLAFTRQMDIYPWIENHGMWLNKDFFIGRHIAVILLTFFVARKFAVEALKGTRAARTFAVLYVLMFVI